MLRNVSLNREQTACHQGRTDDRLVSTRPQHPRRPVPLRVLTGRQIECRWFRTPDVSRIGATRRTQRVLRRLHEQRRIERLARRHGGVRGGSGSFTYWLAPLGRRAIGATGRGTFRPPSERFVDHCIAVAEIAVGLHEAQEDGRICDLLVATEPDNWRRFQTASGIATLKPDLLAEFSTSDGWELRWFIEADRGTEHLPTVLTKCGLYERYWRSGTEDRHHEVFPRIAWSVPDQRRADQITAAIGRTRTLSADLFRTATADQTVSLLATNQPIDTTKGGQP